MKALHIQRIASAFFYYFLSNQVFAVDYTITTVVDTTTTNIVEFPDTSPSINNSGTVAYKGELASGAQNIYTSNSATPISSNQQYFSQPVINDSGIVAISMEDSSGTSGVFDLTNGAFIIDSTTSSFDVFDAIAINSSGVVSFVGELNTGVDFEVASTPPLNSIDDTTGAFSNFGLTDINDSGVVSFVADFDSNGNESLYSTLSTTAIFTTSNIISSAVINNSNTIAYTDTTNVYSNTVGNLVSSGGVFTEFDILSINNNDAIAIFGTTPSTDSAIYVRSAAGSLDKVIDVADGALGGGNNILIGVSMGPQAINDSGQVVFWAQTVDLGTFTPVQGIYIATPDNDGDGIDDSVDNCTNVANATQVDTDSDGFGNHCDGDFDNSCATNLGDLFAFKAAFGIVDAEKDMNASGGTVNLGDLFIFKALFGTPPGPSADPQSSVTCP